MYIEKSTFLIVRLRDARNVKLRVSGSRKLIRRWDSERELFHDDIIHLN